MSQHGEFVTTTISFMAIQSDNVVNLVLKRWVYIITVQIKAYMYMIRLSNVIITLLYF